MITRIKLFAWFLLAAVLISATGCAGGLSHRCHGLERRDYKLASRLTDEVRSGQEGWTNLGAHTAFNISHDVYAKNLRTNQPAVLLFHELPGFSPSFIALCNNIASNGYTVYAPLFFGQPGDSLKRHFFRVANDPNWGRSRVDHTCRELQWAKTLSAKVARTHHGQPIGAIGNCLTGHFPLGLLDEPNLVAAVLSQPSLPFRGPIAPSAMKRASGLSPVDLGIAAHWAKAKQIPVLGFRCEFDELSPWQRFRTYSKALGTNFMDRTIKGSEYRGHLPKKAHAVLTECHAVDERHPARKRYNLAVQYLERQFARFRERQLTDSEPPSLVAR